MTVNATNPIPGSTPPPSTATSASGSANGVGGLTMNDFLTLMTAQLQNQDPLNPTDSNQFLNQLSELSTVEGISQLNTTLTSLSNSTLSSQALSSAALVGQTILTPASAASYVSGGTLSGAVQVPDGASSVVLTVSDASGATVAQIALPPGAGMQPFSWNGTTADGGAAPSGTYTVTATAVVGATSESAATLLNGTVASVTLANSGNGVTLNTPQLGPVPLGSVQQID
jgi:flagellar basal-body rod modification protein FlgD